MYRMKIGAGVLFVAVVDSYLLVNMYIRKYSVRRLDISFI